MFQVIAFMVLTLVSGWAVGYVMARELRGKATPSPLAIVISLAGVATPAVLAFVLADPSERRNLVDQFLPAFDGGFFAISLLIPLVIAGAGYSVGVWVSKAGLAWSPGIKSWLAGLQMLPIVLIWGLLEEIGWRGYLVPKLASFTSPWASFLVSGLIWGVWHAPQMLFNEQLKQAMKGRLALGMVLWTAQCVFLGSLLGWLQLRSGSFIYPVIAHALVNLLGTVSDSALGSDKDPVLSSTMGIPAIISAAVFCLVLGYF